MHKRHLIAATVAIVFTAGIWVADKVYDATNTVAVDKCGQGNVKAVVNKGLFSTEVICFRDT